MRKPILVALLAAVLLTGLLSPTLTHAQDRLQVVASTSILADIAANVAGDAADVTSLMPLFADPHAYTPAPQDLVTLVRADVIFVVGANFEENLSEAIANTADETQSVTVSNCVDMLPFGLMEEEADHAHEAAPAPAGSGEQTALTAQCAAHHAELAGLLPAEDAHADETAADAHAESLGMLYTLACGGAETAEDGHEHGACDPHVWTNPYNAMLWTLMIRDTLSALDPINAETYAANATAYVAALDTLVKDEIVPMLATIPQANRKLVTHHLAFSYYADAFDLALIGAIIPSASTLAEPSAAEIARLVETIRGAGVPAIFAETTANPTLTEQVARETGAQFFTLYTGSLSDTDGPAPTYLDYMRHNTQVIVEALGGVSR